jgi:hypothetical protein
MEKLDLNVMTNTFGGSRLSAGIAGASCAGIVVLGGVMTFGIAALILGPTCVSMVAYTVWD